MRGDRDQRLAQAPGHVLDKAGLAASGRPLQHHGQAFGEGGFEHRDLVADRLVEGLRADSVGVEVHAHLHEWCVGRAARQREDFRPLSSGFGKHRLMGAPQHRSAQSRRFENASAIIRLLFAALHK